MTLKSLNTPKLIGERDPEQKNVAIPSDTPRTTAGLLSVIGGDDRHLISKTDRFPWRMICSLRLTDNKGQKYVGSGWMVGPRTIITAGHCILDQNAGQMAQIDIMPGRFHDEKPFGTTSVKEADTRVHPTWKKDFDPDFDVGAILLAEPLGEETGWFAFTNAEDSDLKNRTMNVGGYPFRAQNTIVNGEELWWHEDAVKDLSERRIFYATDTSGGQSGSPVWGYDDTNAAPIVVGIHAYGASLLAMNSDGESGTVNSGPRINTDIASLILGWIKESS